MLAGFPICLHYVCKNDTNECAWVPANALESYAKMGWSLTEETQMSYALPEWYKNIDQTKGTILLLDDASRALSHILQACYELIYRHEIWSFKLPPNTTCILTTNPDNGDYNVVSVDEAFSSRYIEFKIKFSKEDWGRWAEYAQIDNRAINFMLLHADELMDDKGTHTHIMNARSYTMFANAISGLDDWEKSENLSMILQMASGCFNDKDNIVGTLFTTFIANKLDKLIPAEDMLLKPWTTVKSQFQNCVYEGDKYRPEIASILHTRFLNYCMYYWSKPGADTQTVMDRLIEFIDASNKVDATHKRLMSEDFLYDIVRTLMTKYPSRTNKFILNPKIRLYIK